jgi:hypothetical protein
MILGMTLLLLAPHIPPSSETRTTPTLAALPLSCEAAGQALFKQKPLRIGGKTPEPKKVRHVITEYPERELAAARGEDWTWVGDLLIDTKGAVRQVFTIEDVRFDPPWPELTSAITAAMLQWRYEPTLRAGKPVPVCMQVTTRAER